MRQTLVMGNWKLNGSKTMVAELINALKAPAAETTNVAVAVCPPVLFLGQAQALLTDSVIALGAQDADIHTQGAFTGENSPAMYPEFGVHYVLVGHSERRTLHGESDAMVAAKFSAVQQAGLVPVLCIGETLEQFEKGETQTVVERQLHEVIAHSGIEALANAVIAYEPVWAIGTGKTATPEIAQGVHAAIRGFLAEQNANVAAGIQILYGGSVKGASAAGLFAMEDIDGALVGGAALQADEFAAIIRAGA
ncbi:triose-phosphate isomerase [Oceanisphaera arctica]|uniref:Triosephosphate isomerase n=1 Tax=Oceanisphaera arctica TaxID=641510 RepID=A0A2P5TID6_9GAMM|nr:triose-phosphate isomerase [Oceanisphaera arctica]PPL14440.1 triose-phosphate isomerase [Oceanisphaera arctica]GHA09916.1 triosephosphate isomerase [Oceanisphaera arctica]